MVLAPPWPLDAYLRLIAQAREGHDFGIVAAALGRSRVDIGNAADRLLPPECRPANPRAAFATLRSYVRHRSDSQVISRAKAADVRKLEPLVPPPRSQVQSIEIEADDAFDPYEFRELDGQTLLMLASALIASVSNVRAREMLSMRLGLSGDSRTLAAIGAEFGVTRERARQVLASVMSGLREDARRRQSPGAVLRYLLDRSTRVDERPLRLAALSSSLNAHESPGTSFLMAASGFGQRDIDQVLRAQSKLAQANRRAEVEARSREAENRVQQRQDARVAKWMADAEWPDVRRDATQMEGLRAARSVNPLNRIGHFTSTKLGRNVHFESGLERKVFRALERSSLVAYYQEQPFAVSYAHNGRDRIYYPDVFVVTSSGHGMVIEVKPMTHMAIHENQVKAAAGRNWALNRGWGWLVMDIDLSLRDVMEHVVPEEGELGIGAALAQSSLSWRDILRFRERHELSSLDLTAAIIHSGWTLTLEPVYRLQL
ncbi:hypothetical protein DOE76_12095 [Leifsonia sp. ku-ls]|nr:hypothetical protein DOE76_12095 [Leifsonia sp. ku-ls]